MLNRKTLFLGCALAVSAANCFAVSELNLTLSSDIVALDYAHTNDDRGNQWSFGALYNDDLDSSLAFFGFNVMGESEAVEGFQTGLGLKLVAHDTFQTAGSLALGGKLRYAPDAWSGFGLEGSAYFAPGMLNSNDADQYFDMLARVTYNVNQQARAFVGFQNITVKYDNTFNDKVKIDNGVNIGFTLTF